MTDFEKLGLLYLGRQVDAAGVTQPEPYLLDARDLTTHAVCVGMTGSGKTGLCLSLLEEAAIDGIPVIAIDPKGDVGNLLLTFPSLDAASFAPWVQADEAARAGLSVEAFAAQEAEKWRTGLASWGQDGARIARLRAAADMTIYTPGSRAGRPLSILNSLGAPPLAVREDEELLGDRVASTVGSLLSLMGIDGDPLTSRDHILLSTLVGHAWRAGQSLDLGGLIHAVQTPPVTRVGVMDLDTFYPQKDRFALATRMNNLLAAPGFAAWLDGDPLDIGQLLYGPAGKPRISIISVAHLDDAERMFVVSLLLGEILAWVRTQPGTTSLRALVYMDEVFGYLPPIANPPSKRPLLTLFKQARAFGVGMCLATQNPVDLDYKALANAGTWLIGRLQTERDRARLLDGLEGAAGGTLDRGAADATITGLGKRRFYVHNVHAKAPVVIESRWALSYLRGPLTREDIKKLSAASSAMSSASETRGTLDPPAPAPPLRPAGPLNPGPAPRPLLPPDVPQCFAPDGNGGTWTPHLYGSAEVDFVDTKRGIDIRRHVRVMLPLTGVAPVVEWEHAGDTDLAPNHLQHEPHVDGAWAPLPSSATQARTFVKWAKDFDRWLSRSQRLDVLRDPVSGLISAPDEDERTFRIRVTEARRADRDAAVDKLRAKYASKLTTATERVRKAEQALGKEQADVSRHRVDASLSTASTIGSAVLGAIFGRRGGVTATTIGKATTAARSWTRGGKEADDVKRAEENLETARQALAELEAEVTGAAEAIESAPVDTAFDTVSIAPKRGGLQVHLVALVWQLEVDRSASSR